MANEKKHDRFLRIAHERKNHVIECLQSLGNCSVPTAYDYETKELYPIFQEIVKKLAEVWHRLSSHSPYPFIPFQLNGTAGLETCGRRFHWDQMAAKAEVLELLTEGGANFTALEPVRTRYNERFENDLCWSFPFNIDDHLGCVLLPVQEGILFLPYHGLDRETYEQFDLDAAGTLTADQARNLADDLLSQTAELYSVLTDIRRALPIAELTRAETEPVFTEGEDMK